MKYPSGFAYCEDCKQFWADASGEFLVHSCKARNGERVYCQTKLALKPEAELSDPEIRLVSASWEAQS